MLNSQLGQAIVLAVKSLMLHKLRSGLTMLGIVFGVFSVIAMMAIGEGASTQAQQQVLQLGATNVIIRSVKPAAESEDEGRARSWVQRYGLTREDYRVLRSTLPHLLEAIPIRELGNEEVRFKDRSVHARIVASTPEYMTTNHLRMLRGRFLSYEDGRTRQNVCVLASGVAAQLFPLEDPIGRPVRFRGQFYRVIGVTQERLPSAAIGGSLAGQDYNFDVYVPIETFYARIGDNIFQVSSGSFSGEAVQLNQITLRLDDHKAVIPTADAVRETLRMRHGEKRDYAVIVPLELLRQAEQLRHIFNIVLGSIAAISLVVGGIGIMNIMLATVTERTREIGIRRALGARRRDIIQQFLTETVVMSGTGGAIGVVMGLLTPVTFRGLRWLLVNFVLDASAVKSDIGRMFAEMQPTVPLWSLVLAFTISVAVGIVFGIYPAKSAAELDPIEALRHE
ncbi:MAG: FtsX-like permease family protein [Planctomycetota bacterium]|nr:MAG: FtsX-like permease family protein [Planctomycetota bacterium]